MAAAASDESESDIDDGKGFDNHICAGCNKARQRYFVKIPNAESLCSVCICNKLTGPNRHVSHPWWTNEGKAAYDWGIVLSNEKGFVVRSAAIGQLAAIDKMKMEPGLNYGVMCLPRAGRSFFHDGPIVVMQPAVAQQLIRDKRLIMTEHVTVPPMCIANTLMCFNGPASGDFSAGTKYAAFDAQLKAYAEMGQLEWRFTERDIVHGEVRASPNRVKVVKALRRAETERETVRAALHCATLAVHDLDYQLNMLDRAREREAFRRMWFEEPLGALRAVEEEEEKQEQLSAGSKRKREKKKAAAAAARAKRPRTSK